jgi:hypothetical protein
MERPADAFAQFVDAVTVIYDYGDIDAYTCQYTMAYWQP